MPSSKQETEQVEWPEEIWRAAATNVPWSQWECSAEQAKELHDQHGLPIQRYVPAPPSQEVQGLSEAGEREELERLQRAFNEVTHQAGLASAPERLATGPSLNDLERAWLDGRDDTVQHIVGDLYDLIDELVQAAPPSSLLGKLEEEVEREAKDADAVTAQRESLKAAMRRIRAAAESDADLAKLDGLRSFLLAETQAVEFPDSLIGHHPAEEAATVELLKAIERCKNTTGRIDQDMSELVFDRLAMQAFNDLYRLADSERSGNE